MKGGTIEEIRNIVDNAYSEVLLHIAQSYPNDFIPLIAKGEYIEHSVKGVSNYMLDYMGDIYKDTTRQKFYITYLNRNYSKEGFYYTNSEEDFFDLNVEIMIFSQIWESISFLKYIARLASIVSGEGYKWNMDIPNRNLHYFITESIITPLTKRGFKVGNLLRDNYNSLIRNAFAHSQYDIDMERQKIDFVHLLGGKKSQKEEIALDKFQEMFLYAIILDNYSFRWVQKIGEYYLQNGVSDVGVVQLPNGKYLQVKIKDRFGGPYYYTGK